MTEEKKKLLSGLTEKDLLLLLFEDLDRLELRFDRFKQLFYVVLGLAIGSGLLSSQQIIAKLISGV